MTSSDLHYDREGNLAARPSGPRAGKLWKTTKTGSEGYGE